MPAAAYDGSLGGMSLQLKPRGRKAVLTLHIVSAGAWIGVDVLVAFLVYVGRTADDPATRGLAYRALGEFVVAPMLVSGLVCLVTGVVLGLATSGGWSGIGGCWSSW